ncbi:MAG: hypothetical protein WA047_07235, partial [Phenylobacterium sp.]|uniref:hypothetical protein n=1 Tax=Phenylobacterium sp. TaxID=1871053 RepID=UPI003BB7834E
LLRRATFSRKGRRAAKGYGDSALNSDESRELAFRLNALSPELRTRELWRHPHFMKVMLVFDEAYGNRSQELGDAFWLVDSPANRTLAEQAWKTSSIAPNSAVFRCHSPASTHDVIEKVQDIDLHHPDWSEIVLVGIEPSAELALELKAEGLQTIPASGAIFIHRQVA